MYVLLIVYDKYNMEEGFKTNFISLYDFIITVYVRGMLWQDKCSNLKYVTTWALASVVNFTGDVLLHTQLYLQLCTSCIRSRISSKIQDSAVKSIRCTSQYKTKYCLKWTLKHWFKLMGCLIFLQFPHLRTSNMVCLQVLFNLYTNMPLILLNLESISMNVTLSSLNLYQQLSKRI